MSANRFYLPVVALSVCFATSAYAMPVVTGLTPDQPQPTQVRHGYGPLPYGLYGPGGHHSKRSHRTHGHRGHGTKTGGPSGGVPGRS